MNIRLPLFLMPALLISACSPLKVDNEPQQRYRLEAMQLPLVSDWGLPRELAVVEPDLPPALNTDRITIFFDNLQVDHYAGVHWSDRLSRLLHEVVIDVVEQLHGDSVDPHIQRSPAYLIRTIVRDFQAVYPGDSADRPPRVEVGLTLVLVETATDKVLATVRVSRSVAATANRLETVIGDLNELFTQALGAALQGLNHRLLEARETETGSALPVYDYPVTRAGSNTNPSVLTP